MVLFCFKNHGGILMVRRIADTLVLQIKQMIAAEGLAAGTRLSERGLAERFRVSRTPVREAIQRLVREGLLATSEDGAHSISSAGALLVQSGEKQAPPDPLEQAYFAIAEDRLAGQLLNG
jgi:DNA-binding transcriptional regulator YhcF (GntR family)